MSMYQQLPECFLNELILSPLNKRMGPIFETNSLVGIFKPEIENLSLLIEALFVYEVIKLRHVIKVDVV
jgi:hypothetical protein